MEIPAIVVRVAIKVKASGNIVFTSSRRAERPTMPVLSGVIPRLKTNQLKWSFTGAFEVSVTLLLLIFLVPFHVYFVRFTMICFIYQYFS
ncbi:hypothetical protein Sjap_016786 [Stephania japonica]|uniref:Uncharacterized protein n=1 Tax=Stephania japonica TaxID=461633 RepID=A0AAP0I4X2_9MAGN